MVVSTRNVPSERLFDSAIDFFAGKALSCDWDSLSKLLCRHFEPPNYPPRLFKEILNRSQETSIWEHCGLYLLYASLITRYGDLSDSTQLDILTRSVTILLNPIFSSDNFRTAKG